MKVGKIEFAVKALIIKNGKVLILHRTDVNKDVWEFPGGRMEFGETSEQTLHREVTEETGLLVTPIKILDTWNFLSTDYQITGIIYLCKTKCETVTLSEEHNAYKWVDINSNIIDNIHPVFKERMENWDWMLLQEECY